jgi:hypothetical protein
LTGATIGELLKNERREPEAAPSCAHYMDGGFHVKEDRWSEKASLSLA